MQIFVDAFRKLQFNDFDMMIIQSLKKIKNRLFWNELNISIEIEIQLTQNFSKFEKKMKQQTSSNKSFMLFLHSFLRVSLFSNHVLHVNRKRYLLASQMMTQITQITQARRLTTQVLKYEDEIEKYENGELKYNYFSETKYDKKSSNNKSFNKQDKELQFLFI